jgi:hypothetical protein
VGVLMEDGSAPAGTTSRFPATAGQAFDPAGSWADQSVRPVRCETPAQIKAVAAYVTQKITKNNK